MNTRLFTLLVITIGLFPSCTDNFENFEAIFGDFTLDVDRKIATFDGTISSKAEVDLEEMLGLYDTVEEIKFENASGSANTNAAFAMADMIRANNLKTSLIENGEISQLATYVFIGGENRAISSNSKIGVSSWKTSNGTEASTLMEDDSAHQPFINFLINKGYSEVEAKEFYFFTLNAASSSDTYYLNQDEIENFNLIN